MNLPLKVVCATCATHAHLCVQVTGEVGFFFLEVNENQRTNG